MQALGFGHWLFSRFFDAHKLLVLSVSVSSSYRPTWYNNTMPPVVTSLDTKTFTCQTAMPPVAKMVLFPYTAYMKIVNAVHHNR